MAAREPTENDLALARELLTAHWTTFERQTEQSRRAYTEALQRTVEDPDTAVAVLNEMARIALTAVMLRAAALGLEYEDALADLFSEVANLTHEGDT